MNNSNYISFILWGVFILLVGCVIVFGPTTVSVDNSVRRPVLEEPAEDSIDWIDWD